MKRSSNRIAVVAAFGVMLGGLTTPGEAQADTNLGVPVTVGRCIPSPTHECPPMIVAGGAALFAIVPGHSVVGLVSPELINPDRPSLTLTIVNVAGSGGALVCRTPALEIPEGGSVTTTAECNGTAG